MTPQNRRIRVALVLGVGLIAIIVGAVASRRLRPPVEAGVPAIAGDLPLELPPTVVESDAATLAVPESDVSPTPVPAAAAPAPLAVDPEPAAPSRATGLNQPIAPVAPPPHEPAVPLTIAREALGYVGADPDAEQVWFFAINDPAMSAHARSDLIEDLNETGFPDPRHVTEDDLPLIVNRLALIEELAPDAMDQTNADAFAEAYKDLVNMFLKATTPE